MVSDRLVPLCVKMRVGCGGTRWVGTSTMAVSRINVLLVGDAGVGKSVYMHMLETGEFEKRYIPTQKASTLEYRVGDKVVVLHDVMQGTWPVDAEGKVLHMDGVVVMFDVTCMGSYKSVKEHIGRVWMQYGEIKVVVVGNKVDVRDRKVRPKFIKQHITEKYYDMSAKSRYHFERPLLYLAGGEQVLSTPPNIEEFLGEK